jgi:SET domain-containing protein
MPDDKLYKPLPDCLTIKKSNIDGLGLFATKRIDALTQLGITHIKSGYPEERMAWSYKGKHMILEHKFDNDYIRTPLGGFINHSDTPNCFKGEDENYKKGFAKYLYLWTNQVIEEGEELTVKYTLYKI